MTIATSIPSPHHQSVHRLPVREAIATAQHWCILRPDGDKPTRFGALYGDDNSPRPEHIYSIEDIAGVDPRLANAALHYTESVGSDFCSWGFQFMLDFWNTPHLVIPGSVMLLNNEENIHVESLINVIYDTPFESTLTFRAYHLVTTPSGVHYPSSCTVMQRIVQTRWLNETFPGLPARSMAAQTLEMAGMSLVDFLLPMELACPTQKPEVHLSDDLVQPWIGSEQLR